MMERKSLFEPECKWRLIEEFGRESFTEQEDGKLLFEADYTDRENLITWLVTFFDKTMVLEPEEIRTEIKNRIESMRRRLENWN